MTPNGLGSALDRMRIMSLVSPSNSSTPNRSLGAIPKFKAKLKDLNQNQEVNEVNPDYTLPEDIEWITKSPKKEPQSFNEYDSPINSSYFERSTSSINVTGSGYDKDESSLCISSVAENGITVQLTYEPLLMQRLAVHAEDKFFGPEMDEAFRSFNDSGHCAQFTVAVVVDNLKTDLKYILVPLKDGTTIRITIDRKINLGHFRRSKIITREEAALDRKPYPERLEKARKAVRDAEKEVEEAQSDLENARWQYLMDVNTSPVDYAPLPDPQPIPDLQPIPYPACTEEDTSSDFSPPKTIFGMGHGSPTASRDKRPPRPPGRF